MLVGVGIEICAFIVQQSQSAKADSLCSCRPAHSAYTKHAGLITSDKEWRALKGSHADRLPSARFTVVYPREQLADHDNATLL